MTRYTVMVLATSVLFILSVLGQDGDLPLISPNATESAPLGISAEPLSEQLKGYLHVDGGIFVRSVVAGSIAEQSGIRPGDVLISINGALLASSADLAAILESRQPNDSLSIQFLRDGKKSTINVNLGENYKAPNHEERPGFGLGLGDLLQKQLEQLGTRLDGQIDLNRLEQIEQLLGRKVFDVRRGAVVGDAKSLRIEIDRSGEGAAVIRVTRDGKTIEATADDLGRLPDDVRAMLEPLLGSGNRVTIDLGGMVIELPSMESRPSNSASPSVPQLSPLPPAISPSVPPESLVPPAMQLDRRATSPKKDAVPPEPIAPPERKARQRSPAELEAMRKEIEVMRKELERLQNELK